MTLAEMLNKPDWWRSSACRGLGPARFFPYHGEPTAATQAICHNCPVLTECAMDTLETERHMKVSEVVGWRGGMSAKMRRRLIDMLPNDFRPATAECGTDSGYYRHIRKFREEACPACKWAHREATNKRNDRDRRRYAAKGLVA